MNPKGVEELLRNRRELTGENFGEHTIEPWHAVLGGHPFDHALATLYRLVRQGNERVPLGMLVAALNAGREPARPIACDLCGGTGWAEGPRQPTGRTNPRTGQPVTTSCAIPCRCTAGKAAHMLADRIVTGNNPHHRQEPAA